MNTLVYNRPALRPARAFNILFGELLRDTLPAAPNAPSTAFHPAVDILETEAGFELQLALPGVAKDAVNIDFQEGQLVVSGERKAPQAGENTPKFRRAETAYGSFRRAFRLPETVSVKAISAELTDGILRVSLPLDPEKTTKQHIEVR
ncbi:Hsp20/alpha crystallin family protein [uncultured Hymenobacter sp.]|uniref:Hsp20/alpha crystallin family protein n=1 Tax=uncultured Hymenobacter sp. TaxID=170016 RepID=UPI0035CB5281